MEKTHSELVKKNFDLKYQDYDTLIRNLIPRYEEMHSLLVQNLKNLNPKPRILDLGIGTGQTALQIMQKHPQATITGVDISQTMLDQAKLRLQQFLSQIQLIQEDIINYQPNQFFDAAVAVLCIHHLNANQKQEFFKKIYPTLHAGSSFIIADIIKFDSLEETQFHEQKWKKFLEQNLGEEKAEYWFENYKEEDLPDSVSNQIKWLEMAGFKARCIWQYLNYALIVAQK